VDTFFPPNIIQGSTKDREASGVEKAKAVPIFLDIDFKSKNRQIIVGSVKSQLMEQITLDSQLLCKYHVMDYSLLIGIHKRGQISMKPGKIRMNTKFAQQVCQVVSTPDSNGESEVYFMGIIDCFTPYDWHKVVAHTAKKIRTASKELSTVRAPFYSKRFIEFAGEALVDETEDTQSLAENGKL